MTHAISTKSRERKCFGVSLFSKTKLQTLWASVKFLFKHCKLLNAVWRSSSAQCCEAYQSIQIWRMRYRNASSSYLNSLSPNTVKTKLSITPNGTQVQRINMCNEIYKLKKKLSTALIPKFKKSSKATESMADFISSCLFVQLQLLCRNEMKSSQLNGAEVKLLELVMF